LIPGPPYWRVGYAADPLRPPPAHLYAWNSRFDPLDRASRTLYAAARPATCLREVLSDLRPSTAAISRYVAAFGEAARADVPAAPVTASWRSQNVLIGVEVQLDGPVVDLLEPDELQDAELRHAALLASFGLDHLDLAGVTARHRALTQTIAADLYARRDAAAIRFPSKHDGVSCLAVFVERGSLSAVPGATVALTDPPPEALEAVCAGWGLELEPAAAR